MPSYRVVTLGCKVNHYESLQVEEILRELGYTRSEGHNADVVVLNTCSVTTAAAAKSRNLLRRLASKSADTAADAASALSSTSSDTPSAPTDTTPAANKPLIIAMGCWTTSHAQTARRLAGNGLVLTHQDDVASQIRAALTQSGIRNPKPETAAVLPPVDISNSELKTLLLSRRQPDNQRAIVKIQDGCDADCTYCIIPKVRPTLWSKPVNNVVAECRSLVSAGHREIVLTGIFLGAFGKSTAIHKKYQQATPPSEIPSLKPDTPFSSLAALIKAICAGVPELPRLRLSSLEPADVTPELISVLKDHPQVVPHFHIPLQSGSNAILRRMNRQYTREDYLRMIDLLRSSFDRPALTTDIIVGFPSETVASFAETVSLAWSAGFLHIHAFPFSPREGTAAAKWKPQFIHPQMVTDRMRQLDEVSAQTSLAYRKQFVGQVVEILVEKPGSTDIDIPAVIPPATDPATAANPSAPSLPAAPAAPIEETFTSSEQIRHGRCERYFSVHFEAPTNAPDSLTGQLLKLRITRASPTRTLGEPVTSK